MINCDTLEFEPIANYFSHGNQIQKCETKVQGIEILWTTFFPYNIFKDPADWFLVNLILPMDTVVIDGRLNPNYYTDEGFGMPEFDTLETAVNFIEQYQLMKGNT